MAHVLVVDDDPQIREIFRRVLESSGHEVTQAQDGLEGVRMFRQKPADLVITDIYMPEREGLETIRELKRDFPGVRIIAITGADVFMGADHVLGMAKVFGAICVMKKPIDIATLLDVVKKALSD
jgi:DNA-binding response OmpR family regulator